MRENIIRRIGNSLNAVPGIITRNPDDPGFTRNGVIKTLMVVFLILYLGALYSANNAADVSMVRVESSMTGRTNVGSLLKRGRADLKRYYSIDDEAADGYVFYKAISPMSVNELLIIKARDAAQAEQFLASAQAHLESQKTIFGGYGTDQMALLSRSFVGSKGKYVYYICGPDADTWRDVFMSLI